MWMSPSLLRFCPEGFIGIGVPFGTDVFVRNFGSDLRSVVRAVENKWDNLLKGHKFFPIFWPNICLCCTTSRKILRDLLNIVYLTEE